LLPGFLFVKEFLFIILISWSEEELMQGQTG